VISLNKISGSWVDDDLAELIRLISKEDVMLEELTGLTEKELSDILDVTPVNDKDPDLLPDHKYTIASYTRNEGASTPLEPPFPP